MKRADAVLMFGVLVEATRESINDVISTVPFELFVAVPSSFID